ncbi:hypothetical protein A2U01_0039910 [Trifolium medium]|uniref:Uncharacterized protein n=1 Tax=Trifolium medium TaxID=97028 RepID=A0A392Q673_9FABA|nr:hypothetical protein [Trifolium medium]
MLGIRFGFTRFVDVNDTLSLLEKIEGTWFGSFKIRANISSFKRGEVTDDNTVKLRNEGSVVGRFLTEEVSAEISFKHALVEGRTLVGCDQPGEGKQSVSGAPKVQTAGIDGVIEVELVPSNLQKLQHCFVGFLKEEIDPRKFQMMVAMEDFHNVQVVPLGVMFFFFLAINMRE